MLERWQEKDLELASNRYLTACRIHRQLSIQATGSNGEFYRVLRKKKRHKSRKFGDLTTYLKLNRKYINFFRCDWDGVANSEGSRIIMWMSSAALLSPEGKQSTAFR
ncbi:LOW QUALITY PROTEIN: hypothetical protein HZS_6603 [Henneguya salminicola]|nr:LOW QUALITY PROTEIN: hypothetical protein HZS_6603 [Henneguya salminicola]